MPWLTGNWMNQPIPGLANVYRGSTAPVAPPPSQAPSASPAPAGGDYWAQLGSLLGISPAPQQTSLNSHARGIQQTLYNQIPGTGISIAGVGDYMARMRQAQAQQQQAPSNMYGNMPMLGQSSQGSGSGVTGGGRYLTRERARELEAQQRNNNRNRNPMTRSDGSIIDAAAYMRGDRPGMSPVDVVRPGQSPLDLLRGQRPQLAPPNRPARQPKRPSAMFGEPTDRGGVTRASIPGFSNFMY